MTLKIQLIYNEIHALKPSHTYFIPSRMAAGNKTNHPKRATFMGRGRGRPILITKKDRQLKRIETNCTGFVGTVCACIKSER